MFLWSEDLDSLEFSIDETTYSTLLNEKRKSGFKDKSWDEWFKHLFGIKHKSQQDKLENAANKFFYAKNFDQWVKNFAINLNDIWKDDSAKILEPNQNDTQNENSAIVLGAGPAIKKFKHLEMQNCWNTEMQKCRNAKKQKCRNAEIQKCSYAEMQKFRNAEM